MAGYSVTYTVIDQATEVIQRINRRIEQLKAPLERQAREMQRFVDVSGLRQVARGFEDIGKSAFSAFESISRIVPGLAAITSAGTIAGMVRLANATADWANALRINSDHLGTTKDRLQQFQGAAQLAGVNVDTMISSLKSLQETARGAFTGENVQAIQWFTRLGVSIRDANGNLRTSDDLLPEVLRKINQFPEAADRTRVAAAIGGQALVDLNEQFRASGQTLDQWVANYRAKFPAMSEDQLEALRKWRLAYAETETAFDHLGRTLGATLARDFEPVLRWINSFVEKHEPELVRALEAIGAAVTVLGGLFTVQIAGKAVAAVGALSRSMVAFLASPAGVVLMALLGIKAAVEHPAEVLPGTGLFRSFRNIMEGKAPWEDYFPDTSTRGGFGGFGYARHGFGGRTGAAPGGGLPPHAGGGGAGGVSLAQMKQLALDAGFTAEEAPIMAATWMHESSGNPYALGAAGETGIAQIHPVHGELSRQSYGDPAASARAARQIYLKQGFGAWSSYNSGAYKQYLPAAQSAAPTPYTGAAAPGSGNFIVHHTGGRGTVQGVIDTLNQRGLGVQYIMDREGNITATGMQGRHILPNEGMGLSNANTVGMEVIAADDKDVTPAQVEAFKKFWAQHPEFTTIHGHGEVNPGHKQATEGLTITNAIRAMGAAAHLAPVTGGPPVTGSVDVTVTHRNPPPGVTMTATSEGGAVTLTGPRVEQQQLTAP